MESGQYPKDMEILKELGVDEENFEWTDLAMCRQLPKDLIRGDEDIFFNKYESDAVVARQTDEFCLTCPVIKACAEHAEANDESGVWGGIYWNKGKIDKTRNIHKSPQTKKEIKDETGYTV